MELITAPTVRLVAKTEVTDALFEIMEGDPSATDSDTLGEFGGRGCYWAYHKPNEGTRSNQDYLENILDLGHESVLAHASVSFHIRGISRSLAQEMIRSRFLAFSELSQRYVDINFLGAVIPPDADDEQTALLKDTHEFARLRYNDAVAYNMNYKGMIRKEARQAARAHLPMSTETAMLVSGNLRAWRDFLQQRLSVHADKEIQRLAHELLRQLLEIAPNTFTDIAEEYGYDPRFDGVRTKWERYSSGLPSS